MSKLTLEQAENIRALLNYRDELKSQLRELENCSCITGQICDTAYGVNFRWDKGSRQILYLMNGLKEDIKQIEMRLTCNHSPTSET